MRLTSALNGARIIAPTPTWLVKLAVWLAVAVPYGFYLFLLNQWLLPRGVKWDFMFNTAMGGLFLGVYGIVTILFLGTLACVLLWFLDVTYSAEYTISPVFGNERYITPRTFFIGWYVWGFGISTIVTMVVAGILHALS